MIFSQEIFRMKLELYMVHMLKGSANHVKYSHSYQHNLFATTFLKYVIRTIFVSTSFEITCSSENTDTLSGCSQLSWEVWQSYFFVIFKHDMIQTEFVNMNSHPKLWALPNGLGLVKDQLIAHSRCIIEYLYWG